MSYPLVFSDSGLWNAFLPLTFTKPVSELRCGLFTFRERWEKVFNTSTSGFLSETYLQIKFPEPKKELALLLSPNFLPCAELANAIKALQENESLVYKDEIVASLIDLKDFSLSKISKMTEITFPVCHFTHATDLFSKAKEAIEFDFNWITENRISKAISTTNTVLGDPNLIFLEEGAIVECSFLNTKTGPIYIGENAEIMEGSMVRGPFILGDSSKLNLGAKVYGPTSIGPHCKIGGEINNIVVQGYSNKGHDGFIGNSVIGEWCNIGADSNSSNLKNNYAEVKLWNYEKRKFQGTGLQFCGMIMGDHAKTAINTQLNTGTTVGVFANIFKSGFPPNLIPSFSWGGGKEDPRFNFDKALEIVQRVMERRGKSPDEADIEILKHIYDSGI